MFTPLVIALMMANTMAASAVAWVALQAALLQARDSCDGTNPREEHFFQPSVSATSVGKS
jgi:hypothetical protein